VKKLNETYPGGLGEYCERAKKLLKDSAAEVNPYEGFVPTIPLGEKVSFSDLNQIYTLEKIGAEEVKQACFVLVAGGLGERLGYNGIKVSIAMELITRTTFLEYYVSYVLAFQKKVAKIPLAIMTSDDTYALTVQLLKENNNFGLPEDQLTIMKQEKVPAMIDNDAHFQMIPGKLLIETKPHGHGDVHTLLHMTGLAEKWAKAGRKWLIFFQDTNPLVFKALPSVLGVSKQKNMEVNSITVPRKPGEAVGAICNLKHKDGRNLTINVEYN